MRAAEDGRISANVGADRKERVKRFADERFNGSMTAVIIAAVDAMTEEEARQRASMPPYIIENINYMRLILHTGTPEHDWALLQQEVDKIWKSLQS